MAGALQLGVNMLPPVPKSDDELENDNSPKRRRENRDTNKQPGMPSPPGVGSAGGVHIDMQTMERLLAAQCQQIVASNQAHLDQVVAGMEDRLERRFAASDLRHDNAEERVAGVERRLQRLEELLAQGVPVGDRQESRRLTLVYGGWKQDTPRSKILSEVSEALEKLGLAKETDSPPFTTGPRRSVALHNFVLRPGEAMSDTRNRMHRVVLGVASARATTSHGKKFWCTYSKTKAERDVASHAAWVKRAMASQGQGLVDRLDVEYATGTVWMGESMVASAKRHAPVQADPNGMLYDERMVSRPWVDVVALSRESGLTQEVLKGLLESSRN